MNLGTEHFVTLVLKLSEKSLSGELMQSWLDKAIVAIETDYLELQERCRQTGYHQESPDEIDLGLQGLEEYREAMGLVEDYLDSGQDSLLQEAANLALSAYHNLALASEENETTAVRSMLGDSSL